MRKISYCVVVAEEQLRESDNELPDPGFISASSAAAEAAVQLDMKREAEAANKQIHPMFRRTSTSSSRSQSTSIVAEERPTKKRKVSGGAKKGMKGVKQEVFEVEDSDDDIELINGGNDADDDKSK
jgi:mevalonate pyrophosphate decarboxylase